MIYYLIFALATAIVAHFSICIPIISRLKNNVKFGNNVFRLAALHIVYFGICLVFAPWIISVIIFYKDEKKQEFIDSVYNNIDSRL